MGRRRVWKARRRRRNSGGDAAVGILIVAAIAVAALGVYLLVIGAVAFVSWLAVVAGKRNAQPAPQMVPASTPSEVPPPDHQYHVVLPVSPDVFADFAVLETATSNVFAAWARQLPKAPSDPRDVIRRLTVRNRLIGRLTTKLDGRRFAWRSAPYRGRERSVSSGAIDPSKLDPYDPPHDLRSRSSYLSLCRHCGGDGTVECGSCGGSARVTCAGCEGVGKKMGLTANGARRLLNCKTCKGKATIACQSCRKGQVDCSTCLRSGRVESWLELDGGPRDGDIQVEPDGDVTRAFVWGKDGVTVQTEAITRDARVLCEVTRDRLLALDDLPADVPFEWRSKYWQPIQAQLQAGERVISQTFTLLEVPSVEVTYSIGGDDQSIELEGLRMLAPPVSADHLFKRRATALNRLAYALGAVPLAVAAVYLIRGEYFWTHVTGGVLLGTTIAAAFVYAVFWHSSLGRGAREWVVGALAPVAAAIALAIIAEPSEAAARRYIEAGQMDLAKAELKALGEPTSATLAPLWAEVHLKETLATRSCAAATEQADRISPTAPQRAVAQAHADQLALTAADTAIRSNDLRVAREALRCASEGTRAGPVGRAISSRIELAAARLCLRSREWPCAFAKAKLGEEFGDSRDAQLVRNEALIAIRGEVDLAIGSAKDEKQLARRVSLRRTAIDLWTRYLVAGSDEPAELVSLRAIAAKEESALAKQEEKLRKRREAEEKRKRELAAREERRRAAEEQRRLAVEERERKRIEAAERTQERREHSCCKYCTRGCPCGDSCISCSRTCHKGRGCAC